MEDINTTQPPAAAPAPAASPAPSTGGSMAVQDNSGKSSWKTWLMVVVVLAIVVYGVLYFI